LLLFFKKEDLPVLENVMLSRRNALAGALALAGTRAARAAAPLKIAYVYVGPVADLGYTYQHEQGRLAMQRHFGAAVQSHYVENVNEGPDCERVLRQLAGDGDGLIFSTSFGFMNSAVRVARQFPEVKFEQATGYKALPNLAEYNLRFYEGRVVCGTIAGMLSKSGVAGYVGAYPIPEVVMGINAFTLAARKVNPAFKVRVVWMNTWLDPGREAEAAKSLIDQGADILADHMDSSAVMQTAQAHGILAFGQSSDRSAIGPNVQLTAIIDNWAPYYIRRVQAALEGSWRTGTVWMGMKDGGVVMAPWGPGMTAPARAAGDKIKAGLIDGSVQAFAGPITDQTGTLRVAKGTVMPDEEVLKMTWLTEGVV
jgi:simple sugar transport system substrate-binding protein